MYRICPPRCRFIATYWGCGLDRRKAGLILARNSGWRWKPELVSWPCMPGANAASGKTRRRSFFAWSISRPPGRRSSSAASSWVKSAQQRQAFGSVMVRTQRGINSLSKAMNRDTDSIWQILGQVKDPEIPVVSVVEMGLICTRCGPGWRDRHNHDDAHLCRLPGVAGDAK